MKTCTKCRQALSLSDFAKKGDGHQARCRKCHAEYTRSNYQANKQSYKDKARRHTEKWRDFLRDQKSRPCTDCGVQYPYYVMDFDHRPDEVKVYEPNKLPMLGSKKKILDEIAKCDVVCANCHRERTWQRAAIS